MPVLESQAYRRDDDRVPFIFAGQPRSLVESTASSQLIRAMDTPANDSSGTSRRVPGRPVSDGAQALLIRSFDVTVAGIAIIILLPLMLLIALLVKMSSPGPALFRQQRVGRDGVLFPCLKFRSMVIDAQVQLDRLLAQSEEARMEWERDQKLRDDPRITPIGDFLRKTSLDELPQLFNILAGQMSIVGPRPIVESEIVRYGSRFADYCSVRPGLTGLWQISGRNDVSYAMRVRLDSRYAHRQSLALNVAICVKTVPAILTSRGCY